MPSTSVILVSAGVVIILAVIGLIILFWRRRKAKTPARPAPETKAAPSPSVSQAAEGGVQTPITTPSDSQKTSANANDAPPPSPTLPTEQIASVPPEDVASKDKIRILIVDDNIDTSENVTRLLYFEEDLEVIGQAYNGREGVEMAARLKPHIVLMDINMPDMDGITATQKMRQQTPYCQVIIMSVQSDQQYMRKAMTAGARDYQTKPFTADQLVHAIRRTYEIGLATYQELEQEGFREQQQKERSGGEPEQKPDEGLVIAVYSPKGGTGTSAIATNLAVSWQKAHQKVVLIDGDLQFGDTMVHLNVQPTHTMGNLVDIEHLEIELLSQILISHPSGLKLLLPPPKPELADLISTNQVSQIIRLLKKDHRIIVVDTGSQLSNQTLQILDEANYILIVTNTELTAIKSVKFFLELAQKFEYSLDRIGVVVNRANIGGGIAIEQIQKVLKMPHMYYLPNDLKIHIATNRGQAIVEHEATAPSAQAIKVLAEKVWDRAGQLQRLPQAEKSA